MRLNTDFLDRCIQTLEEALDRLRTVEADDVLYDIFRAACVQEFEVIQEQCGSLLRKRLRPYFAFDRQADQLAFKPIFRHAAQHGVITVEECERWLEYTEHGKQTALLCGEAFAESTLDLLAKFVADARHLAAIIAEPFDD